MVQSDAIRDEIERVVVERQRLRIRGRELNVGDLALSRQPACGVEHLRREIGRDDARDERCESERRVSGARRDVQYDPIALRLGQDGQPRQAFPVRVHHTGNVTCCVHAELLPHEIPGISHGSSDSQLPSAPTLTAFRLHTSRADLCHAYSGCAQALAWRTGPPGYLDRARTFRRAAARASMSSWVLQ